MIKVPFNKSKITGSEIKYIREAIKHNELSGDGKFSKKCKYFFNQKYNFKNSFLTTSCTDAIEMIAIALDLKKNDEIIIPSFAFVSCANAFETHGAKVIFADSEKNYPNISVSSVLKKISKNTKAIFAIHYAGVACNILELIKICKQKNIILIEDCAHSIDSFYNDKFLGLFGDFSVFSFHETKNITSGEGGLLVVNNSKFIKKMNSIYHKGTNRSDFNQNLVSKYQWVSHGSSFLMSEINSAFLYGQLTNLEKIQKIRIKYFDLYLNKLKVLNTLNFKYIPEKFFDIKSNAHIFYIQCRTNSERNELLNYLNSSGINAVFHYLPLHLSKYYKKKYGQVDKLLYAEKFSKCIIRLPLHANLTKKSADYVIKKVLSFFKINITK